MARSNYTAIMDFGSQTIRVLVGERAPNNPFNILGKGEVEYEGFSDGAFCGDFDSLKKAMGYVINIAEQNAKVTIKDVFVGVPGEFTAVVLKNYNINFSNKKKIGDAEIEALFDNAYDIGEDDYEVINRAPIYFKLDDGNIVIEPSGMKTTSLGGRLSYVLCNKQFIKTVNTILRENFGFNSIEYISNCYAESIFLIPPEIRDKYAVLIDVGYITTNVMISCGEGLVYMKSFSMGGGHISADLYELFDINFNMAESLKRKISLSLEVGENDKYSLKGKEKSEEFNAKIVHEVAKRRIECIVKMINKCIEECEEKLPQGMRYYLTGGGISYIRGAKEYMSEVFGKNLEWARNPEMHLDQPHLSSCYAVFDFAARQSKQKSFWKKFFK